MNEKQNKYKQKAVDSLLNFETVKYYGAEQEEVNQYNTSIKQYQVREFHINLYHLPENFGKYVKFILKS